MLAMGLLLPGGLLGGLGSNAGEVGDSAEDVSTPPAARDGLRDVMYPCFNADCCDLLGITVCYKAILSSQLFCLF